QRVATNRIVKRRRRQFLDIVYHLRNTGNVLDDRGGQAFRTERDHFAAKRDRALINFEGNVIEHTVMRQPDQFLKNLLLHGLRRFTARRTMSTYIRDGESDDCY